MDKHNGIKLLKEPWYKHAIIYSLNVETFKDSNGDGIGDFQGLISELDYIKDLGFDCIWLLPFYPTPGRDNGYDVSDYYNIDPRFGHMGDFVEFIEKANELGIHVIADLVVNHSSIEHKWFQQARKDKNSKYRNYYVWTHEEPKNIKWKVAFPGEEEHVWSYDEEAGEYYLHRFYKEQPDLNVANPDVKKEIDRIIKFWLKQGVSGFRIDAAHMLVQLDKPTEQRVEDFNILNFIHHSAAIKKDVMLLAEADDIAEEIPKYFGKGDRMNVLFNFLLNQNMFLGLAIEEASPIIRQVKKLPLQPKTGQWLNFIRHHDELNLERLFPEDREKVFAAFAPSADMQIYGRGIRRRLAPMIGNNRKLMELIYSLVFSLPGIPMIRYGDEIGMGDDLSLSGRNSIRTAMQWSDEKNAGFSAAHEKKLIKPVVKDGEFSYKVVNVRKQQNDPASFLNWIKKLIDVRKQCNQIESAHFEIIHAERPEILIHRFKNEHEHLLTFHNMSGKKVELTFENLNGSKILLSDPDYREMNGNTLMMNEYGYMWLKIPGR